MKLRRLIPLTAITALVIAGAFAAGLIANAVLASEPAAEPTVEPTPEPKISKWPEKQEPPTLKPDRFPKGTDSGRDGSGQGTVYTWEDGDRTLRVVLQDALVVQDNGAITPGDDMVATGVGDSIVQKQPRDIEDPPPVFRSESGGGLMTLPGGVLLALDPAWDEAKVDRFFTENDISPHRISELEFLENGFLIATEPGFSSLELANELAAQDGVLISSPNWSRELEAE